MVVRGEAGGVGGVEGEAATSALLGRVFEGRGGAVGLR